MMLFEEKFDELASKLAIDQGISFSVVEQARNEKKHAQALRSAQGVANPLDGRDSTGQSNNVLDQVKLGIDFTKLAKLAQHSGKKQLSNYLIVYEKQIVKKIPFYLQVQEYDKAL